MGKRQNKTPEELQQHLEHLRKELAETTDSGRKKSLHRLILYYERLPEEKETRRRRYYESLRKKDPQIFKKKIEEFRRRDNTCSDISPTQI